MSKNEPIYMRISPEARMRMLRQKHISSLTVGELLDVIEEIKELKN